MPEGEKKKSYFSIYTRMRWNIATVRIKTIRFFFHSCCVPFGCAWMRSSIKAMWKRSSIAIIIRDWLIDRIDSHDFNSYELKHLEQNGSEKMTDFRKWCGFISELCINLFWVACEMFKNERKEKKTRKKAEKKMDEIEIEIWYDFKWFDSI